jgi:SSS family solute:Na+ symporter
MNFLHFAILLFAICVIVLVLVSLTAPRPSDRQTDGLTFGRADAAGRVQATPLVLTILLLVLIAVIYLTFTG